MAVPSGAGKSIPAFNSGPLPGRACWRGRFVTCLVSMYTAPPRGEFPGCGVKPSGRNEFGTQSWRERAIGTGTALQVYRGYDLKPIESLSRKGVCHARSNPQSKSANSNWPPRHGTPPSCVSRGRRFEWASRPRTTSACCVPSWLKSSSAAPWPIASVPPPRRPSSASSSVPSANPQTPAPVESPASDATLIRCRAVQTSALAAHLGARGRGRLLSVPAPLAVGSCSRRAPARRRRGEVLPSAQVKTRRREE